MLLMAMYFRYAPLEIDKRKINLIQISDMSVELSQ